MPLKPHPTVLRRLVEEYEVLTATGTGRADPRAGDLAYMLCVSTGTRDIRQALTPAHRRLAAAGTDVPRTAARPTAV